MKKCLLILLIVCFTAPACAQTLTGEAGLWQIDMLPQWSYLGTIPSQHADGPAPLDPQTGLSLAPPAATTLFSGTVTSSAVDVLLMDYDIFDAIVTLCHCTEEYRRNALDNLRFYYPYNDMVWDVDVEDMVSENHRTHPRYIPENPDRISRMSTDEKNGVPILDTVFGRTNDPSWLEILRAVQMPGYTLYITLRTDAAFEQEALAALEEMTLRLTLSDGGRPVTLKGGN